MFSTLTMAMVSWVCAYAKKYEIGHFKYVQLLHVNYTLIRLFKSFF